MAKAQAEANTADFKPMGFEGKARIKELRKMVETAVGCAFEENLFNQEGGKGGGKGDGRIRTPQRASRDGGGVKAVGTDAGGVQEDQSEEAHAVDNDNCVRT